VNYFLNHNLSKGKQYAVGISFIALVSSICFALGALVEYRVVALILLVSVSLIAMFFDIMPVLVSATLSALIWNFLFIPPRFTLHIGSTEDSLMLLMYFLIALVNGGLTYKIRTLERITRRKEARAGTLKLYDTILNSLSHELRTPISAIVAATDNLQSNEHNLNEVQKAELISEISGAAIRLNHQVDNLLNMSRLESRVMRPKKDWCDVTEVIYEAVGRLDEMKPSQEIKVIASESLPLFSLDKGMLYQVIYNLLQNAVFYTPASSLIVVSANEYKDGLNLTVRDNGSGFPEDEIGQVFDKFYRLKNSRTGGTGLGLSIVKGFVQAMNGTIELANAPDKGAVFTIRVPAQASSFEASRHE
jgi:two-component system sensor histidine kinase KdpD